MYCMRVGIMLRARSPKMKSALSMRRGSPDCTHVKMKGSSSGQLASASGILPVSSESVSQIWGARAEERLTIAKY